jgi:hypothetical protein
MTHFINALCEMRSSEHGTYETVKAPPPAAGLRVALVLLGNECAQHRQTLRPSVDGIRSKALRPFGLQSGVLKFFRRR